MRGNIYDLHQFDPPGKISKSKFRKRENLDALFKGA